MSTSRSGGSAAMVLAPKPVSHGSWWAMGLSDPTGEKFREAQRRVNDWGVYGQKLHGGVVTTYAEPIDSLRFRTPEPWTPPKERKTA